MSNVLTKTEDFRDDDLTISQEELNLLTPEVLAVLDKFGKLYIMDDTVTQDFVNVICELKKEVS